MLQWLQSNICSSTEFSFCWSRHYTSFLVRTNNQEAWGKGIMFLWFPGWYSVENFKWKKPLSRTFTLAFASCCYFPSEYLWLPSTLIVIWYMLLIFHISLVLSSSLSLPLWNSSNYLRINDNCTVTPAFLMRKFPFSCRELVFICVFITCMTKK